VAAETILVVDDEPPLRELVRVSLGDGYRFEEAADIDSAWEKAHEHRPDLVVLDIMLPGGSGLDLLKRFREDELLAEVPVVVLSAWQTGEDEQAARAAGADAFMPKPFAVDELARVVDELLEAAV
jgi:two-component system phosphate regulon response regulator PhoB